METLPILDFVNSLPQNGLVDVRSPSEFTSGHIPGAINIPLFTDCERAKVGTTFKQVGRKDAIEEGLGIAGPKMLRLVRELSIQTQSQEIGVYCWRGGMRSSSMAWLFETAGYHCKVLSGGYKSYRRLAESIFDPFELVLLGGETGAGKTEVLKHLREGGEQVVDLEALANHRGSAFGGISQGPQPTSEHFQNLVIGEFLKLDSTRRVFIEDESSCIGKVGLPERLWRKMKASQLLHLDVPLEGRVESLVKEYGNLPKSELAACIQRIGRKLGGQNVRKALEDLESPDLRSVARILLTYYDKSYRQLLQRNQANIIGRITADGLSTSELAQKVVDQVGIPTSLEYDNQETLK